MEGAETQQDEVVVVGQAGGSWDSSIESQNRDHDAAIPPYSTSPDSFGEFRANVRFRRTPGQKKWNHLELDAPRFLMCSITARTRAPLQVNIGNSQRNTPRNK